MLKHITKRHSIFHTSTRQRKMESVGDQRTGSSVVEALPTIRQTLKHPVPQGK